MPKIRRQHERQINLENLSVRVSNASPTPGPVNINACLKKGTMSTALMSQTLLKVAQADDPREGLLKQLGNTAVEHYQLMEDDILLATYIRPEKTKGGIIIPDTAKEKPQEGEVVAAGSGSKNEKGEVTPLDVKAGDRILFGKWSGTEVKIDGEDLLIMKESDIMGVLDVPASKKKAA